MLPPDEPPELLDEESSDGELDESLLLADEDEEDEDLSAADVLVDRPPPELALAPVLPDEAQPASRNTDEARATPTRVRMPPVVDMVCYPHSVRIVRATCARHATARVPGPLPGFGACYLKTR